MNKIPIKQSAIHTAALAVVRVLGLDEKEGVDLADALTNGKYIRIHDASAHQIQAIKSILESAGALPG